MVRSLLACLLLLGAAPLAAQEPPPRLVVAIAVDQFSADLFARYRGHFDGGLARLQQGAVFPSGYQGHAATETCPGHSTILTGKRPANTGIIANNWYDLALKRANKKVYCAEDESRTPTAGEAYVPSAAHLRVPTLGDMLKQVDPRSRNVAVAGKDRSALMMGGRNTDEVYFWLDNRFRTLDERTETAEIMAANAAAKATIANGADGFETPEWCGASGPVTAGPVTVGTGRLALPAGDTAAFRASPHLDEATLALAEKLVEARGLGQGEAPDLLSIGLSATDYVGHTYGNAGSEMCIQLARLDRELGAFFDFLDARQIDYAVVLTADHGGFDLPERQRQRALGDAQRIEDDLLPAALGAAIASRSGVTRADLHEDGAAGDIWFETSLGDAGKQMVMDELRDLAMRHPQVAAVFSAKEIAATPMPSGPPDEWSLIERARASYDAERSGDALMVLRKNVLAIARPRAGSVAGHGSPWDYDRRVPILFWRKGRGGFEQPAPVETVDIAPTLAALLGLGVSESAFDGRCLDLDPGPGDTCAR